MSARTFHYSARTLKGELVRGSMQAADAGNVLDLLRSRALFVTSVDTESELADRLRRTLRLGAVPQRALLAFFRSFATLLRAGVSIQRALNVTIDRAADPRLAETLRSILADIESGAALSAAMSRHPREFPPLYVAMIRAGETGGILDDVLERLALLLERESALRQKVQTALAYPAVVVSAACVLLIFLIVNVVPMFASVFAGFGVELPLATRLLVWLGRSAGLPTVWFAAAACAAAAALTVYRLVQHPAGASALDAARLRLPIVGPLLRRAITARTVRMLATLLRSGVELVAAIDAIVPVAGSPTYARAFARVNDALRDGEPLAEALARCPIFDPMFVALVRVGEETGLLDEMLLKLAEYFERDVETAIATLGAVIEPVLIIVLGGVVGFIVFSIFLPLYSLIGSVSQ
jgi:type IV pilus assembly protein PilC